MISVKKQGPFEVFSRGVEEPWSIWRDGKPFKQVWTWPEVDAILRDESPTPPTPPPETKKPAAKKAPRKSKTQLAREREEALEKRPTRLMQSNAALAAHGMRVRNTKNTANQRYDLIASDPRIASIREASEEESNAEPGWVMVTLAPQWQYEGEHVLIAYSPNDIRAILRKVGESPEVA